jgi:hypothetical protein
MPQHAIGHAHCFGLSFEFGPSHFTCSFGCNWEAHRIDGQRRVHEQGDQLVGVIHGSN